GLAVGGVVGVGGLFVAVGDVGGGLQVADVVVGRRGVPGVGVVPVGLSSEQVVGPAPVVAGGVGHPGPLSGGGVGVAGVGVGRRRVVQVVGRDPGLVLQQVGRPTAGVDDDGARCDPGRGNGGGE